MISLQGPIAFLEGGEAEGPVLLNLAPGGDGRRFEVLRLELDKASRKRCPIREDHLSLHRVGPRTPTTRQENQCKSRCQEGEPAGEWSCCTLHGILVSFIWQHRGGPITRGWQPADWSEPAAVPGRLPEPAGRHRP